MKLNLKKVLMGVAVGFAASLTISSNLNCVFALTKTEKAQEIAVEPELTQKQESETVNEKDNNVVCSGGCPTIIDENNKPQTDRLVLATCVEIDPDDSPDEYTYVFDIPMETSEVVKNFKSGKLTVKAKNNDEIVTETTVDLKDIDLNNNDQFVVFEMPAKNLPDSDNYVFEVYDGDKFKGKFEHVKINLKENIPSEEDNRKTLEWFDKTSIKSVNGEKTSDHMEGCYDKDGDVLDMAIFPKVGELNRLARKVEGSTRNSVLDGHNKISLVYKDKNTGEKKLEKEINVSEHEGIVQRGPKKGTTYRYKSFDFKIKNSEIEFEKVYDVEVYDENKQLLGTMEHSLKIARAKG